MTLFRRFFLALFLVIAAPALAAGDADWLYRGSDIPRDPAWTFGSLPNGVRYAVRKNALPKGQVSVRLRIDAGSLHERDEERGWAHFSEHMAFRGTKSFADRQARETWQRLGANFGSDTNAFTSPTQTVYQLDLPDADESEIDLSLNVIAEMADSALFDPATVEAEKRVILAEKGRKPELAARYMEVSWPLFYAGLKIADRETIGTEATLRAATAPGLRAFYERWYRPERATVIVVGDADPQIMEKLIAKHFSAWKGEGPAPAEPDYGAIRKLDRRAAALAYPGAPNAASILWLRPYEKLPNTRVRERIDMARSLAAQIIDRRLEAKARGEAAFITAGVGETRQTNIADMTQLSITAKAGKWREAMTETFAILSDALRAPPSATEIGREIKNLRTAALSGVEGEATFQSQARAQQLIGAIDGNSVVATAATSLALLDEISPQMTPALVHNAMRELFSGAGPRLMMLSAEPIPDDAVNAGLAAAEKAPPAKRLAEREVSFANLPKPGPPGREVSRQRIEDLDVTIVRFANGSTLTFKQTDYEKGQVSVQLRFGSGLAGLPADRPSLAWTGGVVGPSGLADLDLDALERLLTGRQMAMNFGVGEDAFVLGGATNGTDLPDQMRLMAAKLAFPRWDEPLFNRFKAGALENYELSFASAASRAGREFGGFTRGGDPRWAPVEKPVLAAARFADFKSFFEPLLAKGPIEAIIVGDVDLETAVNAMKASIAALPARAPAEAPAASLKVRPPSPTSEPVRFTHQGDKDQAYAAIGWNTFGGTGRIKERRALSLAANMFQTSLFDRLREAEGASYSPGAISTTSENFPDWGIFYAQAEIRPESAATFFRIAREIVAEMAAKAVSAEIFARAQNPVTSGIARRLKTNGYWLGTMEKWTSQPELIEHTRTYLSDYAAMSAEDVRAAVAKHVADTGDWSMLVLPSKASGGGN